MTTRKTNAILLSLVVGLAGLAGYLVGNRPASPTSLGPVPDDTFLLALVDVASLRTSPMAEPLSALIGRFGILGGADLNCSADLFKHIDSIAVAVPEGGAAGDFGLALRARSWTPRDVVACAEKVIAARGGSPASTQEGAFRVIEDRTVSPESATGAKVAVHEGGPYLLGRGEWLTKMMAAVEGKHATLESNASHMELLRALGPRAIAVSVLLPAPLRERLKREMGADAKGGENGSMTGILGVASAALGVGASQGAEAMEFTLEIRCDREDACREVEKLVEKRKASWSKDSMLRLLGLGPLFDVLVIHVEGTSFRASTQLPLEATRRILDRLLQLLGAPSSGAPWKPPSAKVSPSGAPAGTGPSGSAPPSPLPASPHAGTDTVGSGSEGREIAGEGGPGGRVPDERGRARKDSSVVDEAPH